MLSPLCPHPVHTPGLGSVHRKALWDRWRGRQAAGYTHVVEDGQATEEGAQVEAKPPAADGEGAHEAAAGGATSPAPPEPSPQPQPRAYLASQNFLVRQGRSWLRRLRNQRWVCCSVRPHWAARRAIWGWGGVMGGSRRWLPVRVPGQMRPSCVPPSRDTPDVACGIVCLWTWGGVPQNRPYENQPCSQERQVADGDWTKKWAGGARLRPPPQIFLYPSRRIHSYPHPRQAVESLPPTPACKGRVTREGEGPAYRLPQDSTDGNGGGNRPAVVFVPHSQQLGLPLLTSSGETCSPTPCCRIYPLGQLGWLVEPGVGALWGCRGCPGLSLFLTMGPHPTPRPHPQGSMQANGDGGGHQGALTSLGFHPSVRKYFSRVALGFTSLLA